MSFAPRTLSDRESKANEQLKLHDADLNRHGFVGLPKTAATGHLYVDIDGTFTAEMLRVVADSLDAGGT